MKMSAWAGESSFDIPAIFKYTANVTLPAFLLGCLIATLYGAFFHLIVGGKLGRLFVDLLFAWLGFWLGQALAGLFGLTFASFGPLRLGVASVSSLGFLFIGHWLTLVKPDQSYPDR